MITKKAAFRSIGCRTNQEEVAALRAELFINGFSVVDELEDADVIVVNTCSVTSSTESKTRRFIASIPRAAPNARILVTGCFAQQHGESLLKYPGVAWVVGNADKHRIPAIISAGVDRIDSGAFLADINDTDSGGNVFWESGILGPGESGRTRFSLKIQEGCDFRCAYCIVPSLRGRSRSAPEGRLIDTFRRAVDMGYKEIVLTGTHIGQYRGGKGSKGINDIGDPGDAGGRGLERLLEELLKVPGDYRIRLSSLDPRDLTDSLVDVIGGEARVCDHLHVSVQSLCADVLAGMDRPCHDLDKLIERLCRYREKYPFAGLGGDFIVGHPGETEAMFEATLRNVERVGFTYGHVFRFSKRAGTKAASMPGQVGEAAGKSRSGVLRGLLEKKHNFFLSLLFARPLCIIIESEKPTRGVAGNYVKVEVPASHGSPPKNSWMRVALTGAVRGGYCIAGECV